MPRTEEHALRHMNGAEREIRRQYLLEHPEDDLRLPPFTTGHPDEISDWWDAKQAAAAPVPVVAEVPAEVPGE